MFKEHFVYIERKSTLCVIVYEKLVKQSEKENMAESNQKKVNNSGFIHIWVGFRWIQITCNRMELTLAEAEFQRKLSKRTNH